MRFRSILGEGARPLVSSINCVFLRRLTFFGISLASLAVSPAAMQIVGIQTIGFEAVGAEPASSQESIALRYQRVQSEYQQRLGEFLKLSKREPAVGTRLKSERDRKLGGLISTVDLEDLKSLSVDDAYALCQIAELLGRNETLRRTAEHCLAVDPDDERAYFPLVRNLLNEGRFDEARRIVAEGERECGKDSRVGALNGPLFMYSRHRGMFPAAFEHVRKALDHFVYRSSFDPGDAALVGDVIQAYRDLVRSSGRGHASFDKTVNASLDQVRSRLKSIDGNSDEPESVGRHLAQLRIASQLEPSRVKIVELHSELIAQIACYARRSDNPATQKMIGGFIRFVGESSMHWRGEQQLGNAIDTAIRQLDQAVSVNSEAEGNLTLLKKTRQIYRSQARVTRRIDQPWRPQIIGKGVRSAGGPAGGSAGGSANRRVVCFWNPVGPQSKGFFSFVASLASNPNVDVELLSIRSGFSFSDASPFPVRTEGINHETELRNLKNALPDSIPADVTVTVMDRSEFEVDSTPLVFPTILVVDTEGRLTDSVWGIGHLQQNYLRPRLNAVQ